MDKLFTSNYCFILIANFLLFFSFYLIMPILPFYLIEEFGAKGSTVGIVLSCYMIAALCMRPFSGFLLDAFARKPFYIISYFVFTAIFGGYIIASTLTAFIILRTFHGFAYGMVSVAGNTIVVDITPSSRRGEAVGYFGIVNNIAMSVGPMVGLFLYGHFSYSLIFSSAVATGAIGVIMSAIVSTPFKPPVKRPPLSLDRFILLKGLPAGLNLLIFSIPYGMTSTYIALYAKEMGYVSDAGLFFTFIAIGLILARLFAGRLVDKGKIVQLISIGQILAAVSFIVLALCKYLAVDNLILSQILFFTIAFVFGISYGIMFPAYNTLFVNLAPNSRRGTAVSTYLTFWDIGVGIGLLLGGTISQFTDLSFAYFLEAFLCLIAIIVFNLKVGPHFTKNKLR